MSEEFLTREFYPWVEPEHITAWLKELEKEDRLVGVMHRPYTGRLQEYHGKSIKVVQYREK